MHGCQGKFWKKSSCGGNLPLRRCACTGRTQRTSTRLSRPCATPTVRTSILHSRSGATSTSKSRTKSRVIPAASSSMCSLARPTNGSARCCAPEDPDAFTKVAGDFFDLLYLPILEHRYKTPISEHKASPPQAVCDVQRRV